MSEIGSPARDFPPRARSLFQQPTHRGAMSMVHEQYEPVVPKEEYDRIKEQCTNCEKSWITRNKRPRMLCNKSSIVWRLK